MQHTTSQTKLENTASGSAEPITALPMPSPGTMKAKMMNSPKFSAHTALRQSNRAGATSIPLHKKLDSKKEVDYMSHE